DLAGGRVSKGRHPRRRDGPGLKDAGADPPARAARTCSVSSSPESLARCPGRPRIPTPGRSPPALLFLLHPFAPSRRQVHESVLDLARIRPPRAAPDL